MAAAAVALVVLSGCRRDADDRGVGTSSVGAGGANGAAGNNTGKAEPVKGTEREPSPPANRDSQGGTQPAEPAGEKRSGGGGS